MKQFASNVLKTYTVRADCMHFAVQCLDTLPNGYTHHQSVDAKTIDSSYQVNTFVAFYDDDDDDDASSVRR